MGKAIDHMEARARAAMNRAKNAKSPDRAKEWSEYAKSIWEKIEKFKRDKEAQK